MQTAGKRNETQAQLEQGRILLLMTSCQQFDQIRVLSLRDLQLTAVFKHIWRRCVNLQLLFLGGNKITSRDIIENMHQMPQLVKIDLSSNNLKYFPREEQYFTKMVNMEVLILQDNLIESISEMSGLRGAKNLKHLILADNPVAKTAVEEYSRWDSNYRFELLLVIPQLIAIDFNVCTDDEYLNWTDCASIRFRSLNTFSLFPFQVFQNDISANSHVTVHIEHMKMLQLLSSTNSAVSIVQRLWRAHKIRRLVLNKLRQRKRAVIKVQSVFRGWRARVKMELDMVNYMKEIGMQHLTMSNEERQIYEASLMLYIKIVPAVRRWRARFKAKKYKSKVDAILSGFMCRERMGWMLKQPLDLGNTPSFLILKEQKYLFARILKKQSTIEHRMVEHLGQLFVDAPQWELQKDVDFDKFDMPRLPILQITKPSSFVAIQEQQKQTGLTNIHEPLPKFFATCSGGNKDQIENEYNELMKFRIFFKHASAEEKKALTGVFKTKQPGYDSACIDDMNSDFVAKSVEENIVQVSNEQNFLYGKIVGQRHGSDFLKFDLNLSNETEIREESNKLILRVIRAIIHWNKEMPENGLLIFFPELLNRQVAAFRIQTAYRQHLRKLELYRMWDLPENQASKDDFVLVPNCFTLLKCLRFRRAAIIIQQYWSMYRLRKRIKMLGQIRQYISTINDDTLYLEQHLYLYMQNIQFSCIYNNTIPDLDLFAFDFQQGCNEVGSSLDEAGPAWELVFSDDFKGYSSRPCQLRNIAMTDRLRNNVIPNWVVDGHSAINQRSAIMRMASEDRNNPIQIIHKTQYYKGQTEVLDYQQIVPSEQRMFSVNKGLRFVNIKCVSVDDAKRRGLALALMTFNRKQNTFLKLQTKDQMRMNTFLTNIQTWWKIAEVTKLGNDYLAKLLNTGERQDLLPENINNSHSGLILTKKDFHCSAEAHHLNATFVYREPKRINNEVKCLELHPQIGDLTMSSIRDFQASVTVDSAYGRSEMQIEERASTKLADHASLDQNSLDKAINKKFLYLQQTRNEGDYNDILETKLIESLAGSSRIEEKSPMCADLTVKASTILNQGHAGSQEHIITVKNQIPSGETSNAVNTIDSIEDETEYTGGDGIHLGSRTMIGNNTQMKHLYGNVQPHIQTRQTNDPYANNIQHQNVRVSSMKKIPSKFQQSLSSLEPGRSMTTKDDSLVRDSQSQSQQEICARVIEQLQQKPQSRFTSHQQNMTTTQFKIAGHAQINKQIPLRNIQTAKGVNRRPLTSKQAQNYVIYNGQSSQQHSIRLVNDSSVVGSSKQETNRIQSAIFARKEHSHSNAYLKAINQHQERAVTAKLTAVTVDRDESVRHSSQFSETGINTRSVQDLKVNTKISLYRKGMLEITDKNIEIKKARAVSSIVKQAVTSDKDSKMKLVHQLNRLQKQKNKIVIQENRNYQQIELLEKRQERAQSSYIKKSQHSMSKEQSVTLGKVASMLNKVHSSKIIQTKQRISLKSAQKSVQWARQQKAQSVINRSIERNISMRQTHQASQQEFTEPGLDVAEAYSTDQTLQQEPAPTHATHQNTTYPSTREQVYRMQGFRRAIPKVFSGIAAGGTFDASQPDSIRSQPQEMKQIFTTMNSQGAAMHEPETALLPVGSRQASEQTYGPAVMGGGQVLTTDSVHRGNFNQQRVDQQFNIQQQWSVDQFMNKQPVYEQFGMQNQDVDTIDASGENKLHPRSYKIPQASLLNKMHHQRSGQTLNNRSQKSNRSMNNDDLHSDLHQVNSQQQINPAVLRDPNPTMNHLYYHHLQGMKHRNAASKNALETDFNKKNGQQHQQSIGTIKPIVSLQGNPHLPIMNHPLPGNITDNMTDALPVKIKEYRMATKNMQVMTGKKSGRSSETRDQARFKH